MAVTAGPKVVENGLVLSYDFANKKSFSANVHPGSTNIYDWYVGIRGNAGANQSILSKDTIESPVGNTPLKMEVTGSDPHLGSYNSLPWNLDEATSGDTWTVSVYAKASTNTTCAIFIFGINASGSYIEAPAGTRNITTEWQRISFTHTFTNSDTRFIQSRLDGPESSGAGQTIWFDGWQVERGPTATNFTSFYRDGNVVDLSGKGDPGLLVNSPAFSDDDYGSLIFDGVNDYLELSTTTLLSTSSTISSWINIDDFTTGKNNKGRVFIRRTGFNFNNLFAFYDGGYSFETNTNSNPHEISGRQNGNVSSSAISPGSWFHFALVFDANTFYGYVNGIQTGTAAISDNLIFDRIGDGSEFADTYPAYFKGKISNFKIYNRALTPQEVKQNFEATRGRFNI